MSNTINSAKNLVNIMFPRRLKSFLGNRSQPTCERRTSPWNVWRPVNYQANQVGMAWDWNIRTLVVLLSITDFQTSAWHLQDRIAGNNNPDDLLLKLQW